MKAWVLENLKDDDAGISLVFADTRNEAKKQAYYDSCYAFQHDLEPEKWTDIRATRAQYADDMENESEDFIMLRLVENGWWFRINGVTKLDNIMLI